MTISTPSAARFASLKTFALGLASLMLATTPLAFSPGVEAAPKAASRSPARSQSRSPWLGRVTVTPEGGYVRGNPQARIRLVEYGSFTCSHCAEFTAQSRGLLIGRYVASGRVAFEFRPYLRNALDLSAALALGCGSSGRYFINAHHLYATQVEWMTRMQSLPRAEIERIDGLPLPQRLRALADAAGFSALLLGQGLTTQKLNVCFADSRAASRLEAMTNDANQRYQPEGTPFFLLNEKPLPGVYTWNGVEAALASLGA